VAHCVWDRDLFLIVPTLIDNDPASQLPGEV